MESITVLLYFWVHIVRNLSQMKRKLETWSKSFQEAFDKMDFDRAVEATQRMRYYERAMEETVKKL
jgi:molecular chaperone HscB